MESYPLRKCKKILIYVYHLWRKKKKKLLPAQSEEIQKDLRALQGELLKKNREGADCMARKCVEYGHSVLKKRGFEQLRDFILALGFALAVALLVRQVWFELYEIPTGSMRPTFKEKDRLVVSKTTFGINFPFRAKQIYFDPSLVKRGDVIVFTAENLDVPEPDTLYFWIFPGKKQLVKRMLGKPGDIVYFYGGKIYGIDQEGNDISNELQLSKIDHVPFLHFDGQVSLAEPYRAPSGNAYRMAVIHQMNEPVARLTSLGNHRFEGEMLPMLGFHDRNSPPVKEYYELWGMGNYAAARIVEKDEAKTLADKQALLLDDARYYLELKHHPSFKHLELSKDRWGRMRPQFVLSTSLLPLDEEHLKNLFSHIYTGRFIVKNGYAMRYSHQGPPKTGSHFQYFIRLEGVPDGTYEYYHGQAYQIQWGGIAKALDPKHPLMRFSPELTLKLYNSGFDFDKRSAMGPRFDTARFAYYREGSLYTMGSILFQNKEQMLEKFLAQELERKEQSNAQNAYVPFIDPGPPVKENGAIDQELIKKAGLLIPPNGYLALGDNYAMSGDSREFGFVPGNNLRGSPAFIFWPLGDRLGPPIQPPSNWFTLPNVIIWTLGLLCLICWIVIHRRHHSLPLKDL
jgi:signal peptidase I